jgi:hypothetical protein
MIRIGYVFIVAYVWTILTHHQWSLFLFRSISLGSRSSCWPKNQSFSLFMSFDSISSNKAADLIDQGDLGVITSEGTISALFVEEHLLHAIFPSYCHLELPSLPFRGFTCDRCVRINGLDHLYGGLVHCLVSSSTAVVNVDYNLYF